MRAVLVFCLLMIGSSVCRPGSYSTDDEAYNDDDIVYKSLSDSQLNDILAKADDDDENCDPDDIAEEIESACKEVISNGGDLGPALKLLLKVSAGGGNQATVAIKVIISLGNVGQLVEPIICAAEEVVELGLSIPYDILHSVPGLITALTGKDSHSSHGKYGHSGSGKAGLGAIIGLGGKGRHVLGDSGDGDLLGIVLELLGQADYEDGDPDEIAGQICQACKESLSNGGDLGPALKLLLKVSAGGGNQATVAIKAIISLGNVGQLVEPIICAAEEVVELGLSIPYDILHSVPGLITALTGKDSHSSHGKYDHSGSGKAGLGAIIGLGGKGGHVLGDSGDGDLLSIVLELLGQADYEDGDPDEIAGQICQACKESLSNGGDLGPALKLLLKVSAGGGNQATVAIKAIISLGNVGQLVEPIISAAEEIVNLGLSIPYDILQSVPGLITALTGKDSHSSHGKYGHSGSGKAGLGAIIGLGGKGGHVLGGGGRGDHYELKNTYRE